MRKASIIINTLSNSKTLTRCLRFLHQQDYPRYEVIVGCGDRKTEARVYLEALKIVSGDVVMFINDDCYAINRSWISEHMSFYPEWDVVLGYPATTIKRAAFRNFSSKREVFDIVPLRNMDTNHDTDFAMRLERTRLKVKLAPEIRIYHDDWESPSRYISSGFNSGILLRVNRGAVRLADVKYLVRNPVILVSALLGFLTPINHTRRLRVKK